LRAKDHFIGSASGANDLVYNSKLCTGMPVSDDRLIILIAPNVSEQMGGEAMKALQIFCELKKINKNTIQITHERCKAEVSNRLKLPDVYFVTDEWIAKVLWKSRILSKLVDVWFSAKAVAQAERLATQLGKATRDTVIYQTEPNSPVSLRAYSKLCYNAIGPINGNIYYPKIFRSNETLGAKLRRSLHFPLQRLSSLLPSSTKNVDLILAAGGARTIESLIAAGYRRSRIKESIDCGVKDDLLERERIVHEGENFRFVHFGRIVFHKGTTLAIEALKKSDPRVRLDIIGTGPELRACETLVKEVGLDSRVNFLGWFRSHQDLLDSLHAYRGMILPTFEDANGIVVQEAMALGLPSICLDWGGPQLLIENGKSGFLVAPDSREHIVNAIARHLNTLSLEPGTAELISRQGRLRAESWRWSRVADEWISYFPQTKSF
jgi:glycosyltransferase involved in cell wall biosynthesis